MRNEDSAATPQAGGERCEAEPGSLSRSRGPAAHAASRAEVEPFEDGAGREKKPSRR